MITSLWTKIFKTWSVPSMMEKCGGCKLENVKRITLGGGKQGPQTGHAFLIVRLQRRSKNQRESVTPPNERGQQCDETFLAGAVLKQRTTKHWIDDSACSPTSAQRKEICPDHFPYQRMKLRSFWRPLEMLERYSVSRASGSRADVQSMGSRVIH